jgi:hypothetical protein
MIEQDRLWLTEARDPPRPPGPAAEAIMDRSEASELADLQMHWDEAYVIGLDGDIWWAKFRGPTDELRAHTAPSLRELIRADYARRQQMRVAAERMTTTNPDTVDLSGIRGERMST